MVVGPVASVSTGVMNSLLRKLTALIEGEYKHLKSVKGGILFLRDELSSMNALVVKLSNNEERLHEQAREWRNKVRELSYDIEDCIDLFLHQVKRGGGGADATTSIVQNTARKIRNIWARHKIAGVIQGLKASVVEESDRRMRYKVDESVVAADMSVSHPKI